MVLIKDFSRGGVGVDRKQEGITLSRILQVWWWPLMWPSASATHNIQCKTSKTNTAE